MQTIILFDSGDFDHPNGRIVRGCTFETLAKDLADAFGEPVENILAQIDATTYGQRNHMEQIAVVRL